MNDFEPISLVQDLLTTVRCSRPKAVAIGDFSAVAVEFDAPPPALEVAHFSEALRAGRIVVEELPAPQVPMLRVENRGQKPVFIPAGTMLRGGAQTRIVAVPTLVLGGCVQAVEVRCVERGRWDTSSEKSFTAASSSPHSIKLQKLRRDSTARLSGLSRAADQGETWREVDTWLGEKQIRSPSSSLAAALEGSRPPRRAATHEAFPIPPRPRILRSRLGARRR